MNLPSAGVVSSEANLYCSSKHHGQRTETQIMDWLQQFWLWKMDITATVISLIRRKQFFICRRHYCLAKFKIHAVWSKVIDKKWWDNIQWLYSSLTVKSTDWMLPSQHKDPFSRHKGSRRKDKTVKKLSYLYDGDFRGIPILVRRHLQYVILMRPLSETEIFRGN